jgi:hypothetical protein
MPTPLLDSQYRSYTLRECLLHRIVSIDVAVMMLALILHASICGGFYKQAVGHHISILKKLAPEIKVMISVRDKIRGSCRSRLGNIGYLAP